jgi:hypothetical protein
MRDLETHLEIATSKGFTVRAPQLGIFIMQTSEMMPYREDFLSHIAAERSYFERVRKNCLKDLSDPACEDPSEAASFLDLADDYIEQIDHLRAIFAEPGENPEFKISSFLLMRVLDTLQASPAPSSPNEVVDACA